MTRATGSPKGNRQRPGGAPTPVRGALRPDSFLVPLTENGLQALQGVDRQRLDPTIVRDFGDSLDIDKAFRGGRQHDHRFDYLLGHTPSSQLVALEPHPATKAEIPVLIAKRDAARRQLRPELRPGVGVHAWLWVASGNVHFADTEGTIRLLDEKGIRFVGKRLLRKHLPGGP